MHGHVWPSACWAHCFIKPSPHFYKSSYSSTNSLVFSMPPSYKFLEIKKTDSITFLLKNLPWISESNSLFFALPFRLWPSQCPLTSSDQFALTCQSLHYKPFIAHHKLFPRSGHNNPRVHFQQLTTTGSVSLFLLCVCSKENYRTPFRNGPILF